MNMTSWFVLSRRDSGSDGEIVEGEDAIFDDEDLETGGSSSASSQSVVPSLCRVAASPSSSQSSTSPSSSRNSSPTSSLSDDNNNVASSRNYCCKDEEESHDESTKVVSFRAIQKGDRKRIQLLFEQWFPVIYSDQFYDELVENHRLATSGDELFTCAATINRSNNNNDGDGSNEIDMYCQPAGESFLQQQQQRQDSDEIIGCCVGTFIHHSRLNKETAELLVPSSHIHSSLFYIMTLGTVEGYRNLGVATSLVQECMELVETDPSCGALYLHVIPYNTAAIRFYEKLGFYKVSTIPDYYTIDEKNYDCYLYAKYFHGNRGHRTFYKLFSGAMSSLWQHLKAPLSRFVDINGD